MAQKDVILTTNGLGTISKEIVTKTKQLAAATREATWSAWLTAMESNGQKASMFGPWLEVTRSAHEMWLDAYETMTHNAIDNTISAFEKVTKV